MIIAANLKVNHTRSQTNKYIQTLNEYLNTHDINDEIFVFPNMVSLDNFDTKNIIIGSQNAYAAEGGAYTGEVCLKQLKDFGINTILIGHSERRNALSESNDFIKQKFDFFKNLGFKIVFCIGESLKVREQGEEAIADFLLSQIEGIDIDYKDIIVAYEPIWAIGTGVTATTTQIEDTLSLLRKSIKKPLLYGGSVNEKNISEILSIKDCDGALIGTASNDVDNFITMIECVA